MAELTLDTVWWRRFAYFALLGDDRTAGRMAVGGQEGGRLLKGADRGVWHRNTSALDIIRLLDYGAGAVIGPPAGFLQGFLPSYAEPWLKIAIYYPFATTVVLVLVVIAWRMNAYLRDRIQERARLAWNRPDQVAEIIRKPVGCCRSAA